MKTIRKLLFGLPLLGFPAFGFGQGTVVYTSNPVIQHAMKNQGTYAAGTTYAINDVVVYSGASYLSVVANNVGHTPNASPTQWQPIGSSLSVPGSGMLKSNGSGGLAAATAGTDYATPASVTTAQAASLQKSSNLSDVTDVVAARTNLGVPRTAQTGSVSPQGIACVSGDSYFQNASDGTSQQWNCSAHGAVWTNLITGAVVYAGDAVITGMTHGYEMNEGAGTSLTDSLGSTNLAIGGGSGGSPAWATHGLVFNGASRQYVVYPLAANPWTIHSDYLVCFKFTTSNAANYFFGQLSNGLPGLALDAYNDPVIVESGVAATSNAVQPVSINVPTCVTYVYNGDGTDQFWIGSVKLTNRSVGTTLLTPTGDFGIGGAFQGFTGTIYKFYIGVGAALAPDIIQKNALVASTKVAIETSQTVQTTPANYQSGLPVGWFIGDSKTAGNGALNQTYAFYVPTLVQVPGLTTYNNGQNAQLMTNYVANTLPQATSFLAQNTAPQSPPPPHFAGMDMGINDIGANITGSTLYSTWKAGMAFLYKAGWQTIAISLTPSSASSSTQNTERLTYNNLLANGGYWSGFVDWGNDTRMSNGTYAYDVFGKFSPYYTDGLHPSTFGAAALAGRFVTEMLRIGLIGKGPKFNPPYTQYLDVDLANGSSQTITLTGNVSTIKLINGNQGSKLDLTLCQDATGSRTVAAPALGSGATATVTSAGVITLTGGGSGYDQNYMPTLYTSGLTCSTYPRYSSTITNGVVTSITQAVAGVGCSGIGTVVFVSTEPTWNNFDATAVNALAAGACLQQSFSFDGTGRNIY